MAETNGQIQVKGDYGNPSGSGVASLSLYGLTDEAHATVEGKLAAFHAALVTAALTATVACDVAVNFVNPNYQSKPGTDTNIDRKMVVTWREKTATAIRRFTISGVPTTSANISLTDAGERLNDAGRTALQAAIETAYGLSVGDAVVISGVVLQPK